MKNHHQKNKTNEENPKNSNSQDDREPKVGNVGRTSEGNETSTMNADDRSLRIGHHTFWASVGALRPGARLCTSWKLFARRPGRVEL